MSNKNDEMKKPGMDAQSDNMGRMGSQGSSSSGMGGMQGKAGEPMDDTMQVCCEECDWEATGTSEDELAGQYQTHMQGEHNKKMSMAQCREQVEDVGAFEDQPMS